jgi:hypothetical protein
VPNFDDNGTSSLHGGDGEIANIAVQEICPGRPVDHIGAATYDAVAFAIALDALTHDGPADAARIDRAVCAQAFMPGVDPNTFATDFAHFSDGPRDAPPVEREPPLKCYVTAECPRPRHGGGG